MRTMALRVWILVVFLMGAAVAGELPKADLEPVPTLAEHSAALAQAIGAHDRGDYDEAIRRYQEILEGNPDDADALYELAFSQHASGAASDCVETARRGARYRSRLLPRMRMTLANCLDLSGQVKKAMRVYREAVAETPEDYLLRYNYAVTLRSTGEIKKAMDEAKAAVTLNPRHTSSHLLLAEMYFASGEKIPGILASLRFLELEPRSPRSGAILQTTHQALTGSVSRGEDGKVNIRLDAGALKDSDEGDFSAAETMLALGGALFQMEGEDGKKDSPFHQSLSAMERMISGAAGANSDPPKKAFAARYYLPYFVRLKEAEHFETMAYLAYSATTLEDVAAWIDENEDKIEALAAWSERYDQWQGVVIKN